MESSSTSQDTIVKVPSIEGVDECWALDVYSRPRQGATNIGELVRRAKYGSFGPPAALLGDQLAEWCVVLSERPSWPNDLVIVPVPSSARLVEELTRRIATKTGRPVQYSLAAKSAPRIKFLPLAKRRTAARASFRMRTAHSPLHVLLVDDVVHSGETLSAAARMLRSAGATTVIAVVAARVTGNGMIQPAK